MLKAQFKKKILVWVFLSELTVGRLSFFIAYFWVVFKIKHHTWITDCFLDRLDEKYSLIMAVIVNNNKTDMCQ